MNQLLWRFRGKSGKKSSSGIIQGIESELRANQIQASSTQLNANNEISCDNTFKWEREECESLLLKLVPKYFFRMRFDPWLWRAPWLQMSAIRSSDCQNEQRDLATGEKKKKKRSWHKVLVIVHLRNVFGISNIFKKIYFLCVKLPRVVIMLTMKWNKTDLKDFKDVDILCLLFPSPPTLNSVLLCAFVVYILYFIVCSCYSIYCYCFRTTYLLSRVVFHQHGDNKTSYSYSW